MQVYFLRFFRVCSKPSQISKNLESKTKIAIQLHLRYQYFFVIFKRHKKNPEMQETLEKKLITKK